MKRAKQILWLFPFYLLSLRQSIPGIAENASATVLAEIGPDMSPFEPQRTRKAQRLSRELRAGGRRN